jgi:hypothetical protein
MLLFIVFCLFQLIVSKEKSAEGAKEGAEGKGE